MIPTSPQKPKRRSNLLGRLFSSSSSSSSPRDELGLTKTTLRLVPTSDPTAPTFAVFQTRMLTREYEAPPTQNPIASPTAADEENAKIYYAPVRLPQAPIPRIKITKPDDIPFTLKAEEIWPDWWPPANSGMRKRSEEEEIEAARQIWRSNRSFSYTAGEPEVLDTSTRKTFSYIAGQDEQLDTTRQSIYPEHKRPLKETIVEEDIVPRGGEWRRLMTTPPDSPIISEYTGGPVSPTSPVSPVSPTFSEMERISVQNAPILVRNASSPRRSNSNSSTVSSLSSSSSGASRKNSLVRTPSVMHSRRRRGPDNVISRIATDFPPSASESSLSTSSSGLLSSSFPITPPITPPTPTVPAQGVQMITISNPTQDIVNGLYGSNAWTPPSTAGFAPRNGQFPSTSSTLPVANFQKYQYQAYNSPPPRKMPPQESETEAYSPVSEMSGPMDSTGNSAYVVSSRGSVSQIGRRDSLGWESITEAEEPQYSPQTYDTPLEEEEEEEGDIEEPQTPLLDDMAQKMARLKRMREMAIEMQAEKERKEREKEMERNARAMGTKPMVIRRKPVFNAQREGVVVIRPVENEANVA